MNENYEGALAKIDAARKLARQTMAKHGKEEVCGQCTGSRVNDAQTATPQTHDHDRCVFSSSE